MGKGHAHIAVLACIISFGVLTPTTGTLDIIANDISKIIDATKHKLSPPVEGGVQVFTAGANTDTAVLGETILLSAIVLKAGAPALTNSSTQQEFIPYSVYLTGTVVFRANGTVIGNATYTSDTEDELLLPSFEVYVDTHNLTTGLYALSATYEGSDYPPAVYPSSIMLTILAPVVRSLALTVFDATGTKLNPGVNPVASTDIIYALLQLDDDSFDVDGGTMALYLTSANDTRFSADYFVTVTDTLVSVPVIDVVPDMAGSFFTFSDLPAGIINIAGQYNGSNGIATTPVVKSAVQLAVSAPVVQSATALDAVTSLQSSISLPPQIALVLGKAYYLRTVNIFEQLPAGKSLFNANVTACLVNLPFNGAFSFTKFLQTSSEFYDYVSSQTSLSASLNTVKVDAEASYSRTQTSKNDRTSYTTVTATGNNNYDLDFDCVASNTRGSYFTSDFLAFLDSLPLNIANPSSGSSWDGYELFFQKYGSHIVSALTTGGLIQTWTTSDASSRYTQSDFAARACLSAEGVNPLKNQSIAGCQAVSGSSRSASSSFSMSTQVYIRGGTPDTKAALITQQGAYTDASLQKFFNEAATSDSPVDYKWVAIYNLIQQSFYNTDSSRYNKGRNLQAYYEGYIAAGCIKEEKNQVTLKQFSLASGTGSSKFYQCERACRGCRSDDDCHTHNWWAFSCYCEGRGCVVANGDYSTIKDSPNQSSYTDPENASCQYSGGCECNHGDTECKRENKEYIKVGPYYPAQ